ncbi:hypothetical protein KKD62_01700, partial [Patescibacteria group bacterium]|nr:hypothetical protein [Patescibacteria group bacterium]MBU1931765.1 hypothetical protein [Patescibacteria group bacterium]
MKRLLICVLWLPAVLLTLGAAFLVAGQFTPQAQFTLLAKQLPQYISYISLPRVLGAFYSSVEAVDAVPQRVANYVRGTRLEPHAAYLVDTCKQYDPNTEYPLVYWYLAIARIESALCKRIPQNSHNCTGWGIHSAGTLRYSSYEEAIADWCKGFSENYLNEGLTTPDLV